MKFATFLYQTSPNSLAAIARKAEDLGYESLWIPEHIILPVNYKSAYPYTASGRMPAPPETPLHDPMLALTYVAAITTKIRLATGIYVVPIRNPIATAKAVVSIDVLSGGRFIFGVGIGWLKEEFDVVGFDFEDRALRTREYIEAMKELWSKDLPEFHGKTLSFAGAKFMPKPVQKPHPPIVFGGDTEPSLKRAARLGDGWYGIAESLSGTRDVISRLRAHEKALGRTKPLELTVAPRLGEPLTVEHVRQFSDIGIERIILGAGPATRDQLLAMERFHDEVMSRA
ncbi:MAG TPA: LLM class F420-dependent oxidoreductase [Candidatus Binataceae bacterium]|nr:LLM class F420-dependent oxidoreductase [Candidatus Binataceae bacterium]